MKKIVWMLSLISVVLISGCSLFDSSEPTHTIHFNTHGGGVIPSIQVKETEYVDLNNTYIPTKEGNAFDGWYYDESFNQPYDYEALFESDLTMHAKWITQAYTIFFDANGGTDIENQTYLYGTTLTLPEPVKYGYEFLYWQEVNAQEALDFVDMPARDVHVIAVWEMLAGYVTVHFELNGGTGTIADQVIRQNTHADLPLAPTKQNQFFAGWYLDSELSLSFDFNTVIENDMTLYARWVDPHTTGEVSYAFDGDVLSWDHMDEALFYDVYIGDASDIEPYQTTVAQFNFKPYEVLLLDETSVEIYAIYPYGESHLIIDIYLQYQNQNVVYQTDFEAPHFNASTVYKTQKVDGPANYQYAFISGTASTTSPISGNQSVQLRWYDDMPEASITTEFTLESIDYIQFTGKSELHDVKVFKVIGEIKTEIAVIDLTNIPQVFKVAIRETQPFKLKFELVKLSNNTDKRMIYLDDISAFSSIGEKRLTELPKPAPDDYPETDEAALAELKNQYASGRGQLSAPGFTIPMTTEGMTNYYATLNGLTGNQFKTELQQILERTHTRKISYSEARFVLEKSDLITDLEGRQYLDGIYSNTKIVKYWDGGDTWAREHVWPNSRLAMERVKDGERNQASDVHNLRAINPSVNSSRSNRYYAAGLTGFYQLVGSGAYYPGDAYRGDVARILFYMAARYPNILTLREDNLDLEGLAYTQEGAVMGILSRLLEWHELDPVSAFELYRNDVIYSYQGNRNPFIDHHEYAEVYFS